MIHPQGAGACAKCAGAPPHGENKPYSLALTTVDRYQVTHRSIAFGSFQAHLQGAPHTQSGMVHPQGVRACANRAGSPPHGGNKPYSLALTTVDRYQVDHRAGVWQLPSSLTECRAHQKRYLRSPGCRYMRQTREESSARRK